MFPVSGLAIVIVAYGLGCVTAGYYLVRLFAKADIHTIGSGSVGARNVSRVLGPRGFITTLVVDLAKGMIAVWAARYFGLDPYGVVIAAVAVVAGHIWPLQLRFQGGKGVATALGAMLMLDPLIAGLFIGQFLCLYLFIRSLTISGMASLAVTPVTMAFFHFSFTYIFGVAALACMVLYAHRKNIMSRLT